MSIFGQVRPSSGTRSTLTQTAAIPHMMLGGVTHVMVLPLVFKVDAH